MGYIKSPDGIDFVVDPTPLSATEKKLVEPLNTIEQ
jgi:hypothetical protein